MRKLLPLFHRLLEQVGRQVGDFVIDVVNKLIYRPNGDVLDLSERFWSIASLLQFEVIFFFLNSYF